MLKTWEKWQAGDASTLCMDSLSPGNESDLEASSQRAPKANEWLKICINRTVKSFCVIIFTNTNPQGCV